MANNPTKVTLLDLGGNELFSVTESHPESLNSRGSEKTRSIRVEGPANCVVTCFDDQAFRMGQNSVQITKIVEGPVVVPIAGNFIQGQHRNGVYFGSTAQYKWQLNKAIQQHLLDSVISGGWDIAKAVLKGTLGVDIVDLGDGVEGYVSQHDGKTSDNNHVDNLSSIKFGA